MLRQLFLESRSSNKLRRIHLHNSLAHEKLKEGAQRRKLPGNRAFLFLRRVKRCEPFANCQVIDLRKFWFTSLTSLQISRSKVIQELFQVALIVAEGMFADVAFVTKVLDELI